MSEENQNGPDQGREPEPVQAEALTELENMAAEEPGPGMTGPEPEPGPEQVNIPTKELIKPLVALLCVSVAPAWGITEPEQNQLSESYAAVVDKYFPDGIPMGPEVGAVMVTAAIVMPRLGRPLKEPEPETEKGQEQGGSDADR